MTNLSTTPVNSLATRLFGAVVFTALFVVIWVAFVLANPPKPFDFKPIPYSNYDIKPMRQAMAPDSVKAQFDAIMALGNRFPGQPGFDKVQDYIHQAFEDAHLEIHEQPVEIPAPVTLERRICSAAGTPLEGLEIYPFLPNHFQPISTPDEGVTGKLTLVTDDLLLNGRDFADKIALIDQEKPPTNGSTWDRFARLGFKAVIVARRDGLEKLEWQSMGGMLYSTPINFPRLAATSKIFDHLNESVTLHVRCKWIPVVARTLIGILHTTAPTPVPQAVVVSSSYDSCSLLPDLGPGDMNAMSVATQLATLKGMLNYRDQLRRDMVFISFGTQFMGHVAVERLMATLGPGINPTEGKVELLQQMADNAKTLSAVKQVAALCADEKFLATPGDLTQAQAAINRTQELINALPPDARAWLDEQFRYTLDLKTFAFLEKSLQARLNYIRNRIAFKGTPQEDAMFEPYQKAKRDLDEAMAASGYPADKLLRERAQTASSYDIKSLFAKRVAEALALHQQREATLTENLKINETFAKYQSIVSMSAYLAPTTDSAGKDEVVSYFAGTDSVGANPEAGINDMYALAVNDVLLSVSQRYADIPVRYESYQQEQNTHVAGTVSQITVDSPRWVLMGWPAFSVVNTNRSDVYAKIGSPIDMPAMRSVESIKGSLDFFGQTALSMGFGNGSFPPAHKNLRRDFGGAVYAASVGKSIIPNFPLARALVGGRVGGGYEDAGYYRYPFLFTDMYGKFYNAFNTIDYCGRWDMELDVAAFDHHGQVAWIKDQGSVAQSIYKCGKLNMLSANMNMIAFRAKPVTIFDNVNPQTLKSYSGFSYIGRDSLSAITRFSVWPTTTFMEPDTRFFVKLTSGAAGNELTQTTRAFILGISDTYKPTNEDEIEGDGFLASDTPFLLDIPGQVARSMLLLNGKRLALQDRFGMVDQHTKEFDQRSHAFLEKAKAPDISYHDAILAQRDAVTYAQLNHPVLRDSISEAITGVIYYLALLVPFVFFFEKLVFGYTDIRKQIFAQSVIFVVVFSLLWILHPAFEMIRSPAMILLGFVILMISVGVTLLFSSKFGENLEEIRKKQGKVASAQASTSGVVGTAFLLGLNNMHRRKVRTGLTCATLVLMTFAMICFAGVQTSTVSITSAVGKAAYQGLLIKREKFAPIDPTELSALQTKYDYKFTVAPRYMITGYRAWDQTRHGPELSMSYAAPGAAARQIDVASILRFSSPLDPLRDKIRLLTNRGWFTKDLTTKFKEKPPVLIPEKLAAELGITVAQVNASDIFVKVKGKDMLVQGIFDSTSLADLRDIDGRDLLPLDVEAIDSSEMETVGTTVMAPNNAPRLPADRILIASSPLPFSPNVGGAPTERLISVAIEMRGLGYKQAREQIDNYLEQSGQQASFGLDGVAYLGRRTRTGSLDGLFDMIIPLIIAGMTVLNTMNGSVYERRDEIFVYNAVGIAPRYIFFMFIAEAFVYAIVGSILGYILSQATGKILTVLHMTGGLNMTFTSYMTILASALIMAAVFISTIAPGLAAMRIAAPSDDAGWKLPKAEGDTMTFDLPFTFDWRDRVAVLAFFNRYFLDHAEGSAGRFYAADPTFHVIADDSPVATDEASKTVPQISVMIWLKPFDLGVSHRVSISLPRDPETGEFIARITLQRISGTRDSWLRLSLSFVGLLRRHFLHWRAVSADQKVELFDEARSMLTNSPEASV